MFDMNAEYTLDPSVVSTEWRDAWGSPSLYKLRGGLAMSGEGIKILTIIDVRAKVVYVRDPDDGEIHKIPRKFLRPRA